MFTYFAKKFEEEYHNLSLWYFVSFVFGITFFFYQESNYLNHIIFITLPIGIILSIFFLKEICHDFL